MNEEIIHEWVFVGTKEVVRNSNNLGKPAPASKLALAPHRNKYQFKYKHNEIQT